VSFYYWRYRNGPSDGKTLSEFIESGEASKIGGFNLYSEHSEIIVDQVFRYEDLTQAMVQIKDVLGLPEIPQLPKTKTKFRSKNRHYRDELSAEDRCKIERVFAREIKYFDYSW
jgi:hypothetical protein